MSLIRSGQVRWPVTVAVVLLAGLVCAQARWGDGSIAKLLARNVRIVQSSPALGTRVELPGRDSLGRPIVRAARYVIVYLGECQSCSMAGFDPAKLQVGPSDRVVLVTSSLATLIPASVASSQRYNVVGMPGASSILARLDAEVAPWSYALDGDMRLTWVGERPMEMPEGVTYER